MEVNITNYAQPYPTQIIYGEASRALENDLKTPMSFIVILRGFARFCSAPRFVRKISSWGLQASTVKHFLLVK